MVIMTSTGLRNPKVYELILENATNNIVKACVIASGLPNKERHPIAIGTYNSLTEYGISKVDYIDFEGDDVTRLNEYDLVVILGGNSCDLIYQCYKSGAGRILSNMINEKKVIVGASAGAMLLSSGNEYTKYFGDILGIEEGDYFASGLCVTDHILFPHYDIMDERVEGLESKLCALEEKHFIKIERLNNMEFICVDDSGSVSKHI